jgi:type IV pilus biogenesis protein CpaD/CtpE
MTSISLRLLLLGGAVVAMSGCSSTPYLDATFGHAVNAAKAAQTINPEAALNPDPVAGLDGPAAKESIERYRSSFKEPPRTFEIFLGTSGGGAGQ